jgi:chorismate lyase / 3-hydroxybenzoate synthase
MALPAPASIRLDGDAAAPAARLVRFCFGETTGDAIRVPLQALAGSREEIWHVAGAQTAVQSGEREGIRYVANGTWLLGLLRLDDAQDVEQAAFLAYGRMRAFLAHEPYPQLLRVWNFIDRLNQGEGDQERYRRFCVGRHRAIAEPGFEATLPAATVIGTREPGLHLCFLAGCTPGLQIENPRQTSAFLYPRQYGPVSPSFSRATLVDRTLLVSGTAAVVGHVTLHAGDARAQIDELAHNLRALLAHAQQRHFHGQRGSWRAQSLRVYLRRVADLDAILPALATLPCEGGSIAVMQGDISRADLMVEAEGAWVFEPG